MENSNIIEVLKIQNEIIKTLIHRSFEISPDPNHKQYLLDLLKSIDEKLKGLE